MKVVALISGGKDSCFNMMKCVAEGHEIVALANLKPKGKDELDSYMYQTVGHHAIDLYAKAMGLPLYRRTIEGTSKEIGENYKPTADDEVEDLFQLLKEIKADRDIAGVAVGAILSNYQRVRVENVCGRLGLMSLAYLWRRDQDELLREMIDCQVSAIVIKVAGIGLKPKAHLGKSLKEIYPHMVEMNKQYGLNICGEGGEFETFTLDCPLFNKQIVVDETELVIHSDDAFAPVGYLNLRKLHLQDKQIDCSIPLLERLEGLPMVTSGNLLREFGLTGEDLHTKHSPVSGRGIITHKDFVSEMRPQQYFREDGQFWISGLTTKHRDDISITELAEEMMQQLKETVECCGSEMSDLVSVYLYVISMADFTLINSVYKQSFQLNPPCRVCVQVDLPENIPIQLDCYGCKKTSEIKRHTMHVQGLSHWAPANIGPYSQAVTIGRRIYLAGIIPLQPASLTLLPGGIKHQSELCLRHVSRILLAMEESCDLNHISLAVCYVTDRSYIQAASMVWDAMVKSKSNRDIVQPDQLSPLMSCVVVAALPKDSLVEWQVYATIPDIECSSQVQCGDLQKTCDNLSVDLTYIKDVSCTLTCLGYVKRRKHENPDVKDIIEGLFSVYETVLGRLHQTFTDLPSIRMFYCLETFTHEELYNALTRYFEGKTVVPVSLIPVTELSSPDSVIMFCH